VTATKCSPHGWTLDTLERYLTSAIDAVKKEAAEREDRNKERFLSAEKSVSTAMISAEKAISKAEIAADKRFDGLNELRGAMQDQTATLLPRAEYGAQHIALSEKLSSLETRLTKLESAIAGKSQGISGVGAVVAGAFVGLSAVGSIGALIISILKH